jgi:hypothetical protein
MSSKRKAFVVLFVLGTLAGTRAGHSLELSCDKTGPETVRALYVAAHGALPREFRQLGVSDVCVHRAQQTWAVILFAPRRIGPNLEESFRVTYSKGEGNWRCPNTEFVRRLHWEHGSAPIELVGAAAKDPAGSLAVLQAIDRFFDQREQEGFMRCGASDRKPLVPIGDPRSGIESIAADETWHRAVLRVAGQDSFNELVLDLVGTAAGYSVGEKVCAEMVLE